MLDFASYVIIGGATILLIFGSVLYFVFGREFKEVLSSPEMNFDQDGSSEEVIKKTAEVKRKKN